MTYTATKRPLGRTYDSEGRELSFRHTDGTGWDRTYGSEGRVISRRYADGTGWDCTYDSEGRELSRRYADGTGWDYTYDSEGRELSFRHTDGTGWDYTYDSDGHVLSYRHTDGTGWVNLAYSEYILRYYILEGKYIAGCRGPFTREEALAHWNRSDERAKVFTAAILAHKPNSTDQPRG